MPKTRIGLVGYFGHGNYGDELFLNVYKKYFYDCDLVVIPDSGKNPVYGSEFGKLQEIIRSVDALIIGGGDLFIAKYFAPTYFQNMFLDKPIFFHGVGVPLWMGEDPAVVAKMAAFVAHAHIKKISARDAESANWISKKLKPAVPVSYAADMVYALDFPKPEGKGDRKIFGVITRKVTPGSVRWDRITALCERALSFGYKVHNIVLGTGATRDDDLIGLQEWKFTDMTTVDPNDIDELTKAIGACDVIASTKFHGCVVATAYGVPAITMTTTDKFINLYRNMDRSDLISHYLHDDLDAHLSKYMARIPTVVRHELRHNAEASMNELRRAILNEI